MNAFYQCYNENKDKYNWLIYYDMDEFIHLEGYNNIKTYLSKSNYDKWNIIYLNHIIYTDKNNTYYQNKSLIKRFPKIENFKNINMSYQPRTILLDLTKIIIKGNLKDITFGSPHFINIWKNNSYWKYTDITKEKLDYFEIKQEQIYQY